MNRKTYRAAFDQVEFREDFQRETVDLLLTKAGQRQEKENVTMNTKQIKRIPLVAAVAAALIVSAAAATLFLRPADVAMQAGNPTLAAAFESSDATVIDQSVESGDYRFTFAGLVSGAGLSELTKEANVQRSYAVVAAQRIDGQPMSDEEQSGITATPLVSGYLPWAVNAWSLNGGYTRFVQDGVTYYLYEYDSLEMFADRTVYMAIYEGGAPNAGLFDITADGTISFKAGVSAPHALFTVPLDASKADPNAVAEFEASLGGDDAVLTPADMDDALAGEGDAQPDVTVEPEGEGSFVLTEK